jgi:hypothetical protein
MTRLTGKLLGDQAYGNWNSGRVKLDPQYGGQHGWSPNLNEWVSNQAYVRRNLICVLIEAPIFFHRMKNPSKWVKILKSLIELHAISVEGLNAGLEVTTDTHPVGGGGELQDEVTNVKRARTEPTFNFIEKYGMPIQTFLYHWITYGLMDPETKYPLITTLNYTYTNDTKTHFLGDKSNITDDDTSLLNYAPSDLLADEYTATVLFMEPDPTHKTVLKSWLTTNMFPKTTGEIVGKRDLTADGEIARLSVGFTGISQFNLGTSLFAQGILNAINITNANPFLRDSFITNPTIDDFVTASATSPGYKQGIEELRLRYLRQSDSSSCSAGFPSNDQNAEIQAPCSGDDNLLTAGDNLYPPLS